MDIQISQASITFMEVACVIGFAVPVFLLLYFWKKKGATILPFFVGCLVMLVFAFTLEPIVHQLVLGSPMGETIKGNVWLYALYGGLMAALFEETGRLAAFKSVLRNRLDNDTNALMDGAGHGGFEAIVILGITMIGNIAIASMINLEGADTLMASYSGEELAQVEATIQTLAATPAWHFLLGALERLFALALQISLSVLVWFAAKPDGKPALFAAAFGLHFAVDAITAALSSLDVPPVAIEGIVGLCTCGVVWIAFTVWRKHVPAEPKEK